MHPVRLLFTLLSLLFCFPEAHSQWQLCGGPASAQVTDILQLSGGDVLASLQYGQVWRSPDGGKHWQFSGVAREQNNLQQLHQKGSLLFAPSGSGGIQKSTDNGYTWKYVNTGLDSLYTISLAIAGGSLFTSTDSGLYRSDDDAAHWYRMPSAPVSSFNNHTVFGFSGRVFANTSGILQYSDDLGVTWNTASGLPPGKAEGMDKNATHLYAIFAAKAIYKSADNGASWNICGPAGAPISLPVDIACDSSAILAAYQYDGVYRSTDDGLTWTIAWTSAEANYVANLARTNLGVLAGLGVEGGIYATIDEGITWDLWSVNSAPTLSQTLHSYHNILFTTEDIVPYVRRDTAYGDYFIPSGAGLIPGIATTFTLTGTAGKLYFSTLNGYWSSLDSGSSWVLADSTIHQYITARGDSMYYTNLNQFFYSLNTGVSWDSVSVTSPTHVLFPVYTTADKLFLVSNDSLLYMSADGGASWTPGGSTVPGYVTGAMVWQNPYLFAGTNTGCYRTSDFGNTWEPAGSGLASGITNMEASGTVLFASAYSGPVYMSTDYGNSWKDIRDNAGFNHVSDLHIHDGYLYASDWKIWRRSLENVSIGTKNPETPSFFTVYPNPASENITVLLQRDALPAYISLFDAVGKCLFIQSDVNSSVIVPVHQYSAGVYFLRVQNKSQSGTAKIIVH